MKKLIFTIATVATIFANAEMIDVIEKTKSGKIVTNRYDAVEYAQIYVNSHTNKMWKMVPVMFYRLKEVDAAIKCDEILSKSKFMTVSKIRFPLCISNINVAVSQVVPNSNKLVLENKKYANTIKMFSIDLFQNNYVVQRRIDRLLKAAPTYIKLQLRKEGKSFVEKDGKNPVQERINVLTAAFNAKRLSGLNDAMALCGFDYGIDYESALLPEENIKKLCDGIFYGETEFSKKNRFLLRTHLGVKEYNEFVKKYNND